MDSLGTYLSHGDGNGTATSWLTIASCKAEIAFCASQGAGVLELGAFQQRSNQAPLPSASSL